MGVSVTKEGPYFAGGGGQSPNNQTNMRFSQLRNVFKEVTSGSISASELKRNTNGDERNPIVPDAVINEDIAGWNFQSGTGDPNWKVSQMRNSIKRFWATQTGTDINFRMGRYDGSTGIDWGGYGAGGRDSTSSGNGNLTKNIQKYIKIEGTCGSNDSGTWGGENDDPGAGTWTPGTPAARLAPAVPARNVRIWVYGSILGAGGEGGYDSRGYDFDEADQKGADPGTPGGTALKIDNPNGNDVWINVKSGSARIYGGGGGGEQGMNGAIPERGLCDRYWSTSGCGGAPGCAASDGGTVETISSVTGDCCSWGEYCWTRWPFGAFCNEYCTNNSVTNNCKETIQSSRPTQGIGGRGGNGQGYNLSRSNGQPGTDPSEKCPTCITDYALDPENDGKCTDAGRRGGDGGDWGTNGQNTSANNALHDPQPSNGGEAGRAICGNRFTLSGTINNNTIKGLYSGTCPGQTTVTDPCDASRPNRFPSINITNSGSGPYTINWSCTSGNAITSITGTSSPSDPTWNPSTTSGTISVNPSNPTTYTIIAQNQCGTRSGSTSTGGNAITWTATRAASWRNKMTFNKYQGTGQSQIIVDVPADGQTQTQQVNAQPGARYRLVHESGDNGNNWRTVTNGAQNLSETTRNPVVAVKGTQTIWLEDGSNDVTHSDGRSWLDLRVVTSGGAGRFLVDGHTDWPLHINNLNPRNNGRNWIATTGGSTVRWYKTPNESDWSDFMNNYAVYREPQNDPQVGTHTWTSDIVITHAGTYKLAWACDNSGTINFNGTTSNHNSFEQVKTDDHVLTPGTYPITFTVTNDPPTGGSSWADNPGGMAIRMWYGTEGNGSFPYGSNAWSTRDDVAGNTQTVGGTQNDQEIWFWDNAHSDNNVRFTIVNKESSITSARFVEEGRKLRITGGGNITLRLTWVDNPSSEGVALDSIELWDLVWTRQNSNTGSQESILAIQGGNVVWVKD